MKGTQTTFASDAFGNRLDSSAAPDSPYQFSTKRLDAQTGLYDFGARWYDPRVGRFISPDPFGFLDGPNPYVYVKNAPTLFVDPQGDLTFTIAGLIVVTGGIAHGVLEAAAELRKPGDQTVAELAGAFAEGFASGATATAVALLTKNPYASGAAAGATSNLVNSVLTGEFSAIDLALETGISTATGNLGQKIPGLKLVGRHPYLRKVRTAWKQLGKNTYRLLGQEVVENTAAEVTEDFLRDLIAGFGSNRRVRDPALKCLACP